MAYEAYIDATFYSDTYKGIAIDATAFPRLALRASDLLDSMTFRAVRKAGISSYSTDNQELIRLAVCALCEAEAQVDAITDSSGFAPSSEKVGSYSYSSDVNTNTISELRSEAKKKAMSYLVTTGLLYGGIG